MANFSTAATNAAKKGTEELRKQMLDILNNNYANQQEVARNEANTLLNQLNNQATQYQTNYERDARQNYVNSVLNKNAVTDQLKRMGLYDSGFGVSQLGAVDANAATNLTTLKNALQDNLLNINTQRNKAQSDLTNALLKLETNYNEQQLANEQYLTNLYNQLYADEYNRLADEAARQEAIRQFNAKLAEEQRQFDKIQSYSNNPVNNNNNNYNNLLSSITKQYGFTSTDDMATKKQELTNAINNSNLSDSQKKQLENELKNTINKWSINQTKIGATNNLPTVNGKYMSPYKEPDRGWLGNLLTSLWPF